MLLLGLLICGMAGAGCGFIDSITGGEATASTSSWSEGTAATFTVSSDELPEGFLAAVTGANVGSQLLVVSPPAAEGEANSIMVIDVLGIVE